MGLIDYLCVFPSIVLVSPLVNTNFSISEIFWESIMIKVKKKKVLLYLQKVLVLSQIGLLMFPG